MKRRRDKYNRPVSTKRQSDAQKRNFSIFRLRGMLVSLENIAVYGYLKGDVASKVVRARRHIRDALIMETGKISL